MPIAARFGVIWILFLVVTSVLLLIVIYVIIEVIILCHIKNIIETPYYHYTKQSCVSKIIPT